MKASKIVQKATKRVLRVPLASLNYHLGNYEDVIWVVGDGRSGTTWLADLINWHGRYRELFEPFHPEIVQNAKHFNFFEYLRPEQRNSDVADFLNLVFSGKFKNFRADVSQLRWFYEGLLVKDIFANLLLPWVNQNLPSVKKVLVVRNPFATAVSKQKKKGWTWMEDPQDFLKQKELYEDYLAPFENVIYATGEDFIEKQVLIWAIIHYIPLHSLKKNDAYILFYEDLVNDPEKEIEKLFRYLYGESKFLYIDNASLKNKLLSKAAKPSRTSRKKNGQKTIENSLDSWKAELSTRQIEQGIKILSRFGLDKLYGVDSVPSKDALLAM
ncbi:MAG: sulfotransferase domain-containing protein [Thainema sp.]